MSASAEFPPLTEERRAAIELEQERINETHFARIREEYRVRPSRPNPFDPPGGIVKLSDHRLPSIEVRAGELPRLTIEAASSLTSKGGIFQRGGQLVRVIKLDADATLAGVRREAGSVLITPLTKDYLQLAMARAATWRKLDGRSREMRPIDPPADVAAKLLSMAGEWTFPLLTGLTAAPTLRQDGTLLDAPGYDASSGLYGAFDCKDFPAINARPSRDDAHRAFALLQDLYSEFDFAAGAKSPHAAVAIAATITAAIRHAIPMAPAFGISAHKQGSGKTTLARAVAAVTLGREPPVLAFSEDEAELRKCLLGILIAGDAAVLIDNVARPVDSAAFCAVLTSATYSDRVLGVNQRMTVPTATTWLITGNHLEFVGDLTSRTLLAVLDPEVENPETRPFKRDLAEFVTKNRGQLLAAALTIPLAYRAAGSPVVDAARSRFAEWDAMVRRPLLWLGCADPLTTQDELRAVDPIREGLVATLTAWREAFGTEATTVARAIETANGSGFSDKPQLRDALQAVAGDRDGSINARRLGRYLARNLRRIESGLRIEDGGFHPTTCRRLFRVTSVFSVSSNPSRENVSLSSKSGTNAGNERNDGGEFECDF